MSGVVLYAHVDFEGRFSVKRRIERLRLRLCLYRSDRKDAFEELDVVFVGLFQGRATLTQSWTSYTSELELSLELIALLH